MILKETIKKVNDQLEMMKDMKALMIISWNESDKEINTNI